MGAWVRRDVVREALAARCQCLRPTRRRPLPRRSRAPTRPRPAPLLLNQPFLSFFYSLRVEGICPNPRNDQKRSPRQRRPAGWSRRREAGGLRRVQPVEEEARRPVVVRRLVSPRVRPRPPDPPTPRHSVLVCLALRHSLLSCVRGAMCTGRIRHRRWVSMLMLASYLHYQFCKLATGLKGRVAHMGRGVVLIRASCYSVSDWHSFIF